MGAEEAKGLSPLLLTWPLTGRWPCMSICMFYGWCEVSFTWWPLTLPGWSRPPGSMFLGSWTMECKRLTELEAFSFASTASFSIWFVTASINNSRSRVSSWWIYDQISPGLLLNVCRALSLCWAPCVPGHCNVCCVCSPSSSFLALSSSFWGFSVGFGLVLFFLLCSKHEVLSTGPL